MRAGYQTVAGNSDAYVHRDIAEKALGRKLKKGEVVHHMDYNKLNNDPSNLLICTQKYHMLIHARTDCLKAGFNPDTHALCSMCKTYIPNELFPKCASRYNGLHNLCKQHSNAYRKAMGFKTVWTEDLKLAQQRRRAAARQLKEGLTC